MHNNITWYIHCAIGVAQQDPYCFPSKNTSVAVLTKARWRFNLWGIVMNHKPLTLTHWGRVTHICVSKLTIIGSDNGLSPGRCQVIIWTNAGILLIWTLGTNFSKIHASSFTKMHLKRPSAKWRPFCLGLNVLKQLNNSQNKAHTS